MVKYPPAITTERRASDYIAYLDGDRARWEAGSTRQEAVDKLVVTYDLKEWTVRHE